MNLRRVLTATLAVAVLVGTLTGCESGSGDKEFKASGAQVEKSADREKAPINADDKTPGSKNPLNESNDIIREPKKHEGLTDPSGEPSEEPSTEPLEVAAPTFNPEEPFILETITTIDGDKYTSVSVDADTAKYNKVETLTDGIGKKIFFKIINADESWVSATSIITTMTASKSGLSSSDKLDEAAQLALDITPVGAHNMVYIDHTGENNIKHLEVIAVYNLDDTNVLIVTLDIAGNGEEVVSLANDVASAFNLKEISGLLSDR